MEQGVTDIEEPLWKVTSPLLDSALVAFVAHGRQRCRTPELTDAGGHWRPNWKLTRPARVRSSDLVELSRSAAKRMLERGSRLSRVRLTAWVESIGWAVHEKFQVLLHSSQTSPQREGPAPRPVCGFIPDVRAATAGLHGPNDAAGFRQSRRLSASLRVHGPLRPGAGPAV